MKEDYIGPPCQIPQQVSSSEEVPNFSETMNTLVQGIATAFNVIGNVLVQAVGVLVESFEDAMRDNAIRPTGPIVRSTAFSLPDDVPAMPLIPPITEEARRNTEPQ